MSAAGGLANVFGSGAAQERKAHFASIPEVVGIFSDSGPQTDRRRARCKGEARDLDEAARERRELRRVAEQQVTAWVVVHTRHAEDTGPKMGEFSRGGGLSCLPLGANSLRMDLAEWVMPGGRLARAALAGNKRRLAATINVAKTDTWDRLHDGVKHADCPPCPPNHEIPSLCFVAGTCLCSSAGRLCEAFVHGLARLLAPQSARGWLVKKGRARPLDAQGL